MQREREAKFSTHIRIRACVFMTSKDHVLALSAIGTIPPKATLCAGSLQIN